MKKRYTRPEIQVIMIETSGLLMQASDINNNADLGNGGGSSNNSGGVRAPRQRDWTEWEGTY